VSKAGLARAQASLPLFVSDHQLDHVEVGRSCTSISVVTSSACIVKELKTNRQTGSTE
jgi:hypothetical protein